MSRLISPWTKWLPFHRHLQMYFHKWKWLKSFVFWFKFHWILFPRVQLTTNKSALVQVMARHPFGAEPLPEPMLTQLTDAYICGTRGDESRVNVFPQWYLSLSVFRTSVSESMPGVSPIISESEDSITVRWVLESTGIDTMGKGWFDSLAPGRCSCNLVSVIFKLISWIDILNISCEVALEWITQDFTADWSMLVQVMAPCHRQQAITWTNIDQDLYCHMWCF